MAAGSTIYDEPTAAGVTTYETETSFGVQLVFRRGIGSASSGDQSASGRAYDLGIEVIRHGEHLSYGLELGITRQDLSDFAEGYRHSASYVMPRVQKNFGRLALYGGIGYLGLATLDLPSGFGQEGASVRFVGGLRIGIPVQLGSSTHSSSAPRGSAPKLSPTSITRRMRSSAA